MGSFLTRFSLVTKNYIASERMSPPHKAELKTKNSVIFLEDILVEQTGQKGTWLDLNYKNDRCATAKLVTDLSRLTDKLSPKNDNIRNLLRVQWYSDYSGHTIMQFSET